MNLDFDMMSRGSFGILRVRLDLREVRWDRGLLRIRKESFGSMSLTDAVGKVMLEHTQREYLPSRADIVDASVVQGNIQVVSGWLATS